MLRRVGEALANDDHYRQHFQCMTIEQHMYSSIHFIQTEHEGANQRQRKEYCPSAIRIKRAVG